MCENSALNALCAPIPYQKELFVNSFCRFELFSVVQSSDMSQNLAKYVCLSEVEQEALQCLPKSVRGYFESGADDEQTLARNRKAFNRFVLKNLLYLFVFGLLIRPLALHDVSRLDPSVRIKLKDKNGNICFDERFPYPLGIAPTAFQKMAHPDGEEATAKGNNILNFTYPVFSRRPDSHTNDQQHNFDYT
jgi:hypothetical protein